MNNKQNKESTILDTKEEYDVIKLLDTCSKEIKIDSIDLPREYEEKMPLLRKLYPSKKRNRKKCKMNK